LSQTVICCLGLITSATSAGEPVVIASFKAGQEPKQPQVAIAPNGTAHLVYAVGDKVFYCQSSEDSIAIETPKEAFRVSNLSLGMRRGPRIVALKDAVEVSVIGGQQGKGRDGDLQAWRSTDGGMNWQGPVNVNDAADSAREGLHGMTVGSDGSFWCVWLDLRDKHSEVFASQSIDDGATWKANVRVYRSPDGNVCECCHPSITANDDGVHVMFRNSLAGNRDMYVTNTVDGQNFSAARKLGKGSWKLDACPMDGGMLTCDGKNGLVTVWKRDNQIFATLGNGATERLLGPGQQPWAAWSAAGPVMVWTGGREGALSMQIGHNGKARKIAENARDPVVAAHPQSEFAVVCWEAKQDGNAAIMVQRIATPAAAANKAR